MCRSLGRGSGPLVAKEDHVKLAENADSLRKLAEKQWIEKETPEFRPVQGLLGRPGRDQDQLRPLLQIPAKESRLTAVAPGPPAVPEAPEAAPRVIPRSKIALFPGPSPSSGNRGE